MEKSYRYTAVEWEALMDKRVERFNNSAFSDHDGKVNCAVCRNKRLVGLRRGAGRSASFAVGDCTCRDLIRRQDMAKRSGMEQLLMRCGFENFVIRAPWQKQLLDKAKACVGTENWLLLCGQSGCGKTHLAVAVCRELIARGQRVLYMSWPGAVRALKAVAFDLDRSEALLKPFKEAQVLLLDDLFKTRLDASGVPEVSRQELDLAFELLDHRLVHNKRTVITCEVPTPVLRRLSEAITGRILEKAGQFVSNIKPGADRNMRASPA